MTIDVASDSFDDSEYVPLRNDTEDNRRNDSEAKTEVSRSRNRTSDQNPSPVVSLSINVPGRSTRDDSLMYVTHVSVKKGLDRGS